MMVLALLLAVTVVQNPDVPKRKRPAIAIAPLAVSVSAIEAASAALVTSQADLQMLAMQARPIALSGQQIAIALAPLASLVNLADVVDVDSWDQQDPPTRYFALHGQR